VIAFDAEELNVANSEARLYGGQQFARLLSEFRAVASSVTVGDISASEVATAAGPARLGSAAVLAWAASDLAQKRCQRALLPLVEQLYRRATCVLGRLADIVEQMIERQARADKQALDAAASGGSSFGGFGGSSAGPGVSSVLQAQMIAVEDYPYFVHHVKVSSVVFSCRVFLTLVFFRRSIGSLWLRRRATVRSSVWTSSTARA
jgi:hypothetical protein